MSDGFRLFGQVLRLPFYAVAVVLWTIYIFPIVLGFTLVVIVGHALLVPMAYPVAYVLAAFSGEKEPPRWDDYWKDFPVAYLKWLQVGYRGMYRWLCADRST